jgi:long-chain acyl-CoA synthetase
MPTCRRSRRSGLIAERRRPRQPDPAGALRIRRFVNLHKDFDADDGEITRTRKLRRNIIETSYAADRRALFRRGARDGLRRGDHLRERRRMASSAATLTIREVPS